MSHKKKKLEQSAAIFTPRVATSPSLSDTLRALINGLFGAPKPYQPSPQEIADYFLTPREREIAYLAALGFSVQEIADALGMNFQTVRVHLHNILTKMQLDDARALREYFSTRAADQDPKGF